MALCKLHNFCKISKYLRRQRKNVTNIGNSGELFLPRMDNQTAMSKWAHDNVQYRLVGMLDGGHHIDDKEEGRRRAFRHHDDLSYKSMLESTLK